MYLAAAIAFITLMVIIYLLVFVIVYQMFKSAKDVNYEEKFYEDLNANE